MARAPDGAVAEMDRKRGDTEESISQALADPDPAVRVSALRDAPVEGEMAGRIATLLATDSSAAVRAAAAERLGSSDAAASINGLLWGLRDPDPAVVLAVIDALEFSADDSIIPNLEELKEHPEPTVRETAADSIEFLR